jgi:regulator of CtrA degradation
MSQGFRNEAEPVLFGERLAHSQAFTALFRDGMALVEETASYLDGDGRKEARDLPRHAALAYATESMRLTTRLMQLASWLLLHRAVSEGEMSLPQARREKTRVNVRPDRRDRDGERVLPNRLQTLIERSSKVQERVLRLDSSIHTEPTPAMSFSPVEQQLGLLKAAFGGRL